MGEIIKIFHKLHGITTGMFKQMIKLFLYETPLQIKAEMLKSIMELTFKFKSIIIPQNFLKRSKLNRVWLC